MQALISLIVYLIICGILWWAVNAIIALLSPYLAAPFPMLIQIALIIVIAFILISVVMQVAGIAGAPRIPMIGAIR